MGSKRRLLRTTEVAAQFEVNGATVRQWVDKGQLPALRTPGGQLRFRPEDIEQFLDPPVPAA